jgi:hypothetical protein
MPGSSDAKVFEISLSMAGAISAGAYTAGVIDFLVEALDRWEAERGKPGTPPHRVVLRGFAGASAGGITGALAVVALGRDPDLPSDPAVPEWVHVKPLYEAWVLGPDMRPRGARGGLFGADDVTGPGKAASVRAVLDGTVLDQIRDRAFAGFRPGPPRTYLADRFHAYLTLANMRGVPYAVDFSARVGGAAEYGMQTHGDRAHYVIAGLGSAPTPKVMADLDASLPLKTADIVVDWTGPGIADASPPGSWRTYAEATLSTSAFPIGLPPRRMEVALDQYMGRLFPSITTAERVNYRGRLVPAWTRSTFRPPDWAATSPRPIVNVDGGTFDNEPFELARMILLRKSGEQWQMNPRTADTADRAVIMIDPFPDPPEFTIDDTRLEANLRFVAKRLLGVLMNQARFKPQELVDAIDEEIYSRFLISPAGVDMPVRPFGADAIACGLLGGFGGFASQKFRDFDYRLGRRNCQQFLRSVFVVGERNEVVAGGAQTTDKPGVRRLVPLYGSTEQEVVLNAADWPRIDAKEAESLVALFRARVEAILPRLIEDFGVGGFIVSIVKKIGIGYLASFPEEAFRRALMSDLVRRDQLDYGQGGTWAALEGDERLVVAALLASDAAAMTIAALERRLVTLARGRRIDVGRVLDTLGGLAKGHPFRVSKVDDDGPAYGLDSRKPGLIAALDPFGPRRIES